MSNFFQIRYAQSIFNQLGTTVANEYVPFDNCHRKYYHFSFTLIALF